MAVSQQMLLDYLAGPVLTELVASADIAPGLPKPLPPQAYQYSPSEVVGVNAQYDSFNGVRQLGKAVDYLSPSVQVTTQGRVRKQIVALGTRESTPIEGEILYGLMSNIPLFKSRATELMRQKVGDFRQRADNFALTLPHSAFAKGKIWLDRDGNILPSSTNAVVTVDFGLTYGGANALAYNSAWPLQTITVGDWSNASTDIPSSIRAMRKAFVNVSNYKAMHILYGQKIPGYFYSNTSMQTYMSRQPKLNDEFMTTNEVPDGLLDLTWHPTYEAYFIDQNGTLQNWFADNQIVIIPEFAPNWYEYISCSMLVPRGILPPNMTVDQFLENCVPVKGFSSYAHSTIDPIGLNLIQQLYTIPLLKNPLGTWSATVSP